MPKAIGGRRERKEQRFRRRRHPIRRAVVLVVALFLVGSIGAVVMVPEGEVTTLNAPSGFSRAAVDEIARRTGIPGEAVEAYLSAATKYSIDWALLAGIGQEECNHGRSRLPGCPRGTNNYCGARGPMQFLGDTWRTGTDPPLPTDSQGRVIRCPGTGHFTGDPIGPPLTDGAEGETDPKDRADCDLVGQGYATDGNGDGTADPWEWLDATHGAARMLLCNGVADGEVQRAIRRYNASDRYVNAVLQNANEYRAQTQGVDLVGGGGGGGSGEPVNLVHVACPAGGAIEVDMTIAAPLGALLTAAANDGLQLCGGGYRSREEQIQLRREHCAGADGQPGVSDYDIYQAKSSECSPDTAPPGQSMHEVGLAIDFTCFDELIRSRSSPCFQWLAAHAASFGLQNLPREAWHWSTNGS